MTLKLTKEQLIQLLADQDNSVIALTGKWGTGKSHMWEEVRSTSHDEKVSGALYASLFGLSSIDQVKMKLIQSAVPAAEANPGLWAGAKQAVSSGIKVLEGFHKSFGALNELGLLLAPAVLRERLIVLDDIERKHERLNVDEILGFIDEFSQRHDSRFVLILNTDRLDKQDMWSVLREKVVDEELLLDTTATEAFEIAIALTGSDFRDQIRKSVEECGVTNIRIIRRVIKAVNRILEGRHGLSEAVLSRVIPSTVLLSCVHYRGIPDGPTFDYVLRHGTVRDSRLLRKKEGVPESEDSKREASWNLLMGRLGIRSTDEFELLVIELLRSGMFDVAKVAKVIDRYVAENKLMETRESYHRFLRRAFWEHTLTEAELLAEASVLAQRAHLLDAGTVTAFHDTVTGLAGGKEVADRAVDLWIAALRAKNLKEVEMHTVCRQKIHPRMRAEFEAINAQGQTDTSVLEACKHITETSGWGPRQEFALKSATPEDMEAVIRTSTTADLMVFMGKMLDLCIHKQTYLVHFGSAMDNFVRACRSIAQDPSSGRLGKLIEELFAESNLKQLLTPTASTPETP